MKYWGVALAFAAFISVNAEANMFSLFHQLLKSVQNSHSVKNEQVEPDGGGGDSAGGNLGPHRLQSWAERKSVSCRTCASLLWTYACGGGNVVV